MKFEKNSSDIKPTEPKTNLDKILEVFDFKDLNNKSIIWTPTQREILNCILNRRSPDGKKRIHIMTFTRFGKSATVAAGVLMRCVLKSEKWALIAGTKEKARIIMEYVTGYALDDPIIRNQLELEEGGLERLRRERSRDKLTFKKRGEIRVYSGDARNKQAMGESLMGFGSANIIEDESALIDDQIHSKIMRMLGDNPDNFLIKIGNPFRRNHFLKSFINDKYYKIVVDCYQGLKEGRITKEQIEEMKLEHDFGIMYECNFPDENAIDDKGFMPLITESDLNNALVDSWIPFGLPTLGADPADEGNNESVIVERYNNIARIVYADAKTDLMDFSYQINKIIDRDKIDIRNCAIDKIGVGAALPSILKNANKPIIGVNVGEKCETQEDDSKYFNKRAMLAFRVMQWIKEGGKLYRDPRWYQLLNIKYRESENRKMQIMSKKEMRTRGINSPDAFDALALTFNKNQTFYKESYEDMFFRKKREQNIKHLNRIKNPYSIMRSY